MIGYAFERNGFSRIRGVLIKVSMEWLGASTDAGMTAYCVVPR